MNVCRRRQAAMSRQRGRMIDVPLPGNVKRSRAPRCVSERAWDWGGGGGEKFASGRTRSGGRYAEKSSEA